MTFTPQVRLFVHSVFFYEDTGPEWSPTGQVLLGRGLILIQRWGRALVERAVVEAFRRAEGPTWQLAASDGARLAVGGPS